MPVFPSRRPVLFGVALVACAVAAPSAFAGGSGAVFTTDAGGLAVNENLFGSPLEVHLNGGPPCNASRRSAALPDGWYVFRVTDPSGKVDMTAAEPLAERRFRVAARAVVETADPVDHPIATTACGAVLRVGPFATTSATGVYKLWVAPDGAAARRARTKDRGGVFNPCRSKTDNFRLELETPPDGGDGGGGDGGDGGGGTYLFSAPAPTTGTGGGATHPGGKKPGRSGGGGATAPGPAR